MSFRCPVCLYPDLPYEPETYDICVCCGTEFGVDDAPAGGESHSALRAAWVAKGCPWFFRQAPEGWKAEDQLKNA